MAGLQELSVLSERCFSLKAKKIACDFCRNQLLMTGTSVPSLLCAQHCPEQPGA